jgi:hypothetical protein
LQNGDETDVDCGGATCLPCLDGQGCFVDGDCNSGFCDVGVCQQPSCADGFQNDDETDVDCGGTTCLPCADGQACLVDDDCVSAVCAGNVCQVPACADTVQNGSETDVDCGGGCPGCPLGGICILNGDCASGVCTGGFCDFPDLACAGGLAAECADLDSNGIRDDNCVFYACDIDQCIPAPILFSDMGGSFGDCPPDGFTNIHDRTHALNCFAATTTCDRINIDAGGPFGSCIPDGFCNIHDANHAMAAFTGDNICTCPSAPLPELPAVPVGHAHLTVVPASRTLSAGTTIDVRVFLHGEVQALRSYQLDLRATGGSAGRLELVDIEIERRKDAAFTMRDDRFDAINLGTAQMLAGLNDNHGVTVERSSYLATYTYRASADARGLFVIDILEGAAGQTYLVAPNDGKIEISTTTPAIVDVNSSPRQRNRT